MFNLYKIGDLENLFSPIQIGKIKKKKRKNNKNVKEHVTDN